MRSFFNSLIAVAVLSPALAMASGQPSSDVLLVPGVMTSAGERFASQCSDKAFAGTENKDKRAKRCEKLLARWHAEAAQRIARRANPRIEKVALVSQVDGINLPFDTVAMLRSDPFAGFDKAR